MVRRDGWDNHVGGKRKYLHVESGVQHNPKPRTARGERRNAGKPPKKENGGRA